MCSRARPPPLRPAGALQEWYQRLLTRGMREELARVTLARKLAAITLTSGRPENATIQRN